MEKFAVKEKREKQQQLAEEEYGISRGVILIWKKQKDICRLVEMMSWGGGVEFDD